jgi:hypothetical protein
MHSCDRRGVDRPPGQPAQDCGDLSRVLEEERTGRDWRQEGWRVVGRYCRAADLVILSDGSINFDFGPDRDNDRPHRVVVSLLAFGMLVSAELVELWWNVSYALANPDGRHLRRVIGVNGTWPYNDSPNLLFRAYYCLSDHLHWTYIRLTASVCTSSVLWQLAFRCAKYSHPKSGTQLNSLDEPTTIHLHGMFLAGVNYFDGAARVTQWCVPCVCPVGTPLRVH